MIFHTKRNCFLKEESPWEGTRSGMLGCGLALRGGECLSGGEKEKRESGCDRRVGSSVGLVSAPIHATPCLPLSVLLASSVLCAHPVSMCGG